MTPAPPQVNAQPVASQSDVETVRRLARVVATRAGFAPREIEETIIIVSELATNLVKHARDGVLTLSPIDDAGRTGILIESRDAGPGIDDVDRALRDGYSTTGGLGSGLGSVQRLSDSCEIRSGPDGTLITVHKWRKT